MLTKKELDQASDFQQTSFKRYPTIKFTASSGSKYASEGSFTFLENDPDGKLIATDLGKTLSIVLIKRGKFRLKKPPYETNEVVSGKDKAIDVYERGSDGKRMHKERGVWRVMKDKYKLSTFQYPYVLLNVDSKDEDIEPVIAKLAILPSSLSAYWDYCKDFTKERVYEVMTSITASKDMVKGKLGNYHTMEFAMTGKLSRPTFEKVADTIETLDTELKLAQEARQEQQEQYEERPANSYANDVPEETIDDRVKKLNKGMQEAKETTMEDIPVVEE